MIDFTLLPWSIIAMNHLNWLLSLCLPPPPPPFLLWLSLFVTLWLLCSLNLFVSCFIPHLSCSVTSTVLELLASNKSFLNCVLLTYLIYFLIFCHFFSSSLYDKPSDHLFIDFSFSIFHHGLLLPVSYVVYRSKSLVTVLLFLCLFPRLCVGGGNVWKWQHRETKDRGEGNTAQRCFAVLHPLCALCYFLKYQPENPKGKKKKKTQSARKCIIHFLPD